MLEILPKELHFKNVRFGVGSTQIVTISNPLKATVECDIKPSASRYIYYINFTTF